MLAGGPVMMTGRGERVEPVHVAHDVVGRQAVRLPDAIARRVPMVGRGRRRDRAPRRPDCWSRGRDAATWTARRTRSSTIWRTRSRAGIPRSRRRSDAFLEAGALGAVMSGSGPTVVALARDRVARGAAGAVATGRARRVRPPSHVRPTGLRRPRIIAGRPGSSNGKTRAFGA